MASTPLTLEITSMRGERITLQLETFGDETIVSLRARIAESWGRDSGHIQILHNEVELKDGLSLQAALGELDRSQLILLTAVVTECSALEREALQELERLRASGTFLASDYDLPFDAARKGFAEVLRVLAENRADLNVQDTYRGRSLAHTAAKPGHAAVLRLLGEQRASLSARDLDGSTAAHEAARPGHCEAMRVLGEHRAELSLQVRYGSTPAHLAAAQGHVDVLRILGEFRAELASVGGDGKTPAQYARAMGHAEVPTLLAEMCGT